MRRLALIPLLFAAIALAQSVPPQFAGLLSNTTDYTTDGRWTTPATPAPGSCYVDSIFGTTACMIPLANDCPVFSWNPTGSCAVQGGNMNVDYAKVDPWSIDDSYFVTTGNGAWLYLYSRSSGGVYTPLSRINTALSQYGSTADHNGHGLSSDWSNWLWANNASSSPHTIYYTGSTIASQNRTQLKEYNVDTDTVTVVHDFASTIATVNSWNTCTNDDANGDLRIVTATSVDMQREGNQSDDDRYWAFGVTDGSSSGWCAVLVYDKTADSVIALKTIGAGGMCATAALPTQACTDVSLTHGFPNWVGMSPSGTYVVVNWQHGVYDNVWQHGFGTEIYDTSLNWLGVATAGNAHGDVGYDVNGVEVYIDAATSTAGTYSEYELEICKLSIVSKTVAGSTTLGGCKTYVALPCTWGVVTCPYTTGRGNNFYISMRGSHEAAQGWMMFSSQAAANNNSPQGEGGWGALENDAILMNWSAGGTTVNVSSVPAAQFVRIGRSHSIYGNSGGTAGNYEAQVNTATNHTFTKINWTSTMDTTFATDLAPFGTLYSFYTELTGGGGSTSNAGMSGNVRMSGNAVIR